MKINYIKNNENTFSFYDLSIKELMDLELKDLTFDGELNIFDSIPLILKEDIINVYNISLIKKANVKLFYKDNKIGEYINNYDTFTCYECDNFFSLDNSLFYEETFKKYNKRIIENHRRNGVLFLDSETCIISPLVEIDRDNYIFPGVILYGTTKIGKNNSIGPYSYLENFIIGGYNKISWFVGKNSSIGDNNTLGPFSHFRENVTILDGNVIGNFNELKSSELGSNNRMKHLSYLGNAKVQNHVNFGCGVISANYDGKSKHQTTIEDDVFVGCNSTLIAPINIKKGAFIAAQSVICENLDEYDFAISRNKQITKKQYMKK